MAMGYLNLWPWKEMETHFSNHQVWRVPESDKGAEISESDYSTYCASWIHGHRASAKTSWTFLWFKEMRLSLVDCDLQSTIGKVEPLENSIVHSYSLQFDVHSIKRMVGPFKPDMFDYRGLYSNTDIACMFKFLALLTLRTYVRHVSIVQGT